MCLPQEGIFDRIIVLMRRRRQQTTRKPPSLTSADMTPRRPAKRPLLWLFDHRIDPMPHADDTVTHNQRQSGHLRDLARRRNQKRLADAPGQDQRGLTPRNGSSHTKNSNASCLRKQHPICAYRWGLFCCHLLAKSAQAFWAVPRSRPTSDPARSSCYLSKGPREGYQSTSTVRREPRKMFTITAVRAGRWSSRVAHTASIPIRCWSRAA
jgi:hypothetical protein